MEDLKLDETQLKGMGEPLEMNVDMDKFKAKARKSRKPQHKSYDEGEDEPMVCCLRNERIIVRHVPKENNNITNPKHVLYGGIAEDAYKYFSVPKLESGAYVNILTDNEKEYLEHIMGLEYNALSIYKKEDNYWENRMVRLGKLDNYFDLSNPEQYISYKILLANKQYIAHSLQELDSRPKATYMFVIIAENEETKLAKKEMNATMQAYMEFGKIQDNADMLRLVIELIEGRPMSTETKLDALQTKLNRLIQASPKLFIKVVSDEYLQAKLLIKKGVEKNVIANRNGMYYMRDDGSQLCGKNNDPTLDVASRFLSQPANQELKFLIEGKIKD